MEAEIILRYYKLPSEKGEGWASIVLGSNGFFAAVSDYGNYAFMWTHTAQPDVRNFFLNVGREWDYFLGKLSPGPWKHDSEATYQHIKKHILELRRDRQLDAKFAREEWERLHDCDVRENGLVGFHEWYQVTDLGDASEFAQCTPPSDAVAFCKRTMPRWAEMLRAELAAEATKG